MKYFLLLGALLVLVLPAMGEEPPAAPALRWHPLEVAFDCSAGVSAEQPRDGHGSLRLCTRTEPGDTAAWLTFLRVEVLRADGQPLGLLTQLANGGSLTVDMFRHPDSGDGLPDYTLPWVALRVRNPDGEEAVLLWEGAYNGWSPASKLAVPEGQWLDDLRIDTGTVWMRYQQRNYNRGAGFQLLSAYAKGSQAVHKNAPSLKLGAETQLMAVEFGSGANLPGLLLAYVDDVRLTFAGGLTYRYNFEPQ